MKAVVARALAILLAANALAMLFAGYWWYRAVPGAGATGPFNPHFVKDIGTAYLAAALGLGWRAASPAAAGPAAIAASFLTLHAFIHLADAAGSPRGLADLATAFPGVFVPAVLALWIAWPPRRPDALMETA
ncbi:MAG TPA: hypothetical protein VGS12_07005 [Caulobacteraceae bacterium]|nr:hypothetical protein [Caulobacteraceae bacterium]